MPVLTGGAEFLSVSQINFFGAYSVCYAGIARELLCRSERTRRVFKKGKSLRAVLIKNYSPEAFIDNCFGACLYYSVTRIYQNLSIHIFTTHIIK